MTIVLIGERLMYNFTAEVRGEEEREGGGEGGRVMRGYVLDTQSVERGSTWGEEGEEGEEEDVGGEEEEGERGRRGRRRLIKHRPKYGHSYSLPLV